jgi:di/tripeptidase
MVAALVGADQLPKLLAGYVEDLTARIHYVPLTLDRVQNIAALCGRDTLPVAAFGIQLDGSGNVKVISARPYWPYHNNSSLRDILTALMREMRVRPNRAMIEAMHETPAQVVN